MVAFHAIRRRSLLKAGGALLGATLCLAVVFGSVAEVQAATRNTCVPSTSAKPPKHRVLRVGTFNGKKGQCKTIQEAVNAAAPGNWVLIGPGDYKETSSTKPEGAYGDDIAGASVGRPLGGGLAAEIEQLDMRRRQLLLHRGDQVRGG